MSNIVIFATDTIPFGNNLPAGPGIRYYEIAKSLSQLNHNVTLGVPAAYYSGEIVNNFSIVPWTKNNINTICSEADVAVVQQGSLDLAMAFTRKVKNTLPTIIDLYDPILLEVVNTYPSNRQGMFLYNYFINSGIIPLLQRGDFFICASERQRYYYIGILNLLGRINPLTKNEKIIDIVPFGIPHEAPVNTKKILRGKVVNIDDKIILWAGGIYPWFDASTLIKAMEKVISDDKRAKLVFVGGKHPRGHAPIKLYEDAVSEAKEIGLYNTNIYFVDWMPWNDIVNCFLESDIAVSTHPHHLETELSYRTRVVNYLWGNLPVITSHGDEMSNLIKEYKCGLVVEPNNVSSLADAIIYLLRHPEERIQMSKNGKNLIKEYTWGNVIQPIDDFCKNPHLSLDKQYIKMSKATLDWTFYMRFAKAVYDDCGLTGLVKKTYRYLFNKKKI